MDLFSLAVGFVVGAFTGAAGHYFGEKFTDKRRRMELVSETEREWKALMNRFPSVIEEMQKDLGNPETQLFRAFYVKSSNTKIVTSEPSFEYHTDEHPDLRAAIAQLERMGYIEDVTPGNCPMYRMTEEFVDRLKDI